MSDSRKNRVVTTDVLNAFTNFVKGTHAADGTIEREKGKLLDFLESNGVRHTDLISPKVEGSTAIKEDYEAIKEHIVKGWPDAVEELLNMPNKKVPDGEEGIDWKWTQKTVNGEEKFTKKFMPRPRGTNGKGRYLVTRGNRYYWQAQIGSKLNDAKDGLKGRECQKEIASTIKTAKGKGKDAPNVVKVDVNAADIKYFRNVAETGIKRIQKNEAPSYKVAKVQKALNDLLAAMVEAEQA